MLTLVRSFYQTMFAEPYQVVHCAHECVGCRETATRFTVGPHTAAILPQSDGARSPSLRSATAELSLSLFIGFFVSFGSLEPLDTFALFAGGVLLVYCSTTVFEVACGPVYITCAHSPHPSQLTDCAAATLLACIISSTNDACTRFAGSS